MKWKPLMAHLFPGESVLSHQAVSGGCINYCYRIVTDKQAYFVKFNTAARFPRMYACEAFALRYLESTGAVRVPAVLQHGDVEDLTYLVLGFIPSKQSSTKALERLGHDLATLHKTSTAEQYGWEHDNYIGSLPQNNTRCSDWSEFYLNCRVMPLCKKLLEDEIFDANDMARCERYVTGMEDRIPAEPPALLHGDLWSGNFLVDEEDHPILVDPASYFGHREMDVALTKLFGGFGDRFYAAYNETQPLAQGWEQRLGYFQLYPLLVHAVLFGSAYADSVKRIVYNRLK